MKTKKWYRPPTPAEIAAFDGLHCAELYRWALSRRWRCPCCDRTAVELIRWSKISGPTMKARYGDEHGMGFTISLTRHHCHADGPNRFPTTLTCGDCNSADGAAKRRLGLPEKWSFAPNEDPAVRERRPPFRQDDNRLPDRPGDIRRRYNPPLT